MLITPLESYLSRPSLAISLSHIPGWAKGLRGQQKQVLSKDSDAHAILKLVSRVRLGVRALLQSPVQGATGANSQLQVSACIMNTNARTKPI